MVDYEKIENYAKSMVKYGLYSNMDEARKESFRWHEKKERGLEEPMKCPHRPECESSLTYNDKGELIAVTYKLTL